MKYATLLFVAISLLVLPIVSADSDILYYYDGRLSDSNTGDNYTPYAMLRVSIVLGGDTIWSPDRPVILDNVTLQPLLWKNDTNVSTIAYMIQPGGEETEYTFNGTNYTSPMLVHNHGLKILPSESVTLYFGQTSGANTTLYYSTANNMTPTVTINYHNLSGPSVNAGFDTNFTVKEKTDPVDYEAVEFSIVSTNTDSTNILYEWDYEGDGTFQDILTEPLDTQHNYQTTGCWNATLRVTDADGYTSTDVRRVCISTKSGGSGSPPMEIVVTGSAAGILGVAGLGKYLLARRS